MYSTSYSHQILIILAYLRNIFEKYPNFIKICPVGAESSPEEEGGQTDITTEEEGGQTDITTEEEGGQTDITKLIVAFRVGRVT
jgi:hypothetical protein